MWMQVRIQFTPRHIGEQRGLSDMARSLFKG